MEKMNVRNLYGRNGGMNRGIGLYSKSYSRGYGQRNSQGGYFENRGSAASYGTRNSRGSYSKRDSRISSGAY